MKNPPDKILDLIKKELKEKSICSKDVKIDIKNIFGDRYRVNVYQTTKDAKNLFGSPSIIASYFIANEKIINEPESKKTICN